MLHEQIKSSIKDAMMAKDSVKLDVLRGLVTAFTNELVATGHTPQEFLADDAALAVITRTAKQRKDAIAQYETAGRKDLADEDRAQLAILEQFLPTMMSEEEVTVAVTRIKGEKAITDASQKGLLMKEAMNELKGKADGQVVKKVVDSLFT
jgi:uncharacterized protein YqeY